MDLNHIGIINMWVKDCVVNSFQCVDINKILDLKKECIGTIHIYCNISNMVFPVQIFINSNTKLFNKICRIESFYNNFYANFSVYLLSLVFKKYQLSFLHKTNPLSIVIPRYLTESERKSLFLLSLMLTSLSILFPWCLSDWNISWVRFNT